MEFHLSNLHYSQDWSGSMILYVFESDGYHRGGTYFRRIPKYPDEEITLDEAKELVKQAMDAGKEVRITNAGDELVFHSLTGRVVWPEVPDQFWAHCG